MVLRKFIAESNQAASAHELTVIWQKTMKTIGFDRALFSLMMDHPLINRKAGPVVALNYPMAWLAQYSANRYEEIDPVRHYLYSTKGAFIWESLISLRKLTKAQIVLLAMARSAGLYNGVGIPLRGPTGELAAVLAASSTERPTWNAETLDCVYMLSDHYYKLFLRLEQKAGQNEAVQLTDREREVLRLCAAQKSQIEIANAMGVTPHAVKFHMKGIFSKLGVHNQEVAVMKAAAMGLLIIRET